MQAVGKGQGASLAQQAHLDQLLALQALGHGAIDENLDQFHLAGTAGDELDHGHVVDDRAGVRQSYQRGDTARGRSAGDAVQRLLMLLARLAELGAHVDQTGGQTMAVAIHPFDIGRQLIGADVAKIGMNLKRPRPVAAGKFHPEVMAQLEIVVKKVTVCLDLVEKTGVKLALENHTDAFSEEVLWVLDRIDHPMVGACIDTVNGIHVTENPITAVKNLSPRAFTNHFRDNRIVIMPWGLKFTGAAVGEGDLDMKQAYELICRNPNMTRINIELDLDCPLDSMKAAMATERAALERSVAYCRKILGIC